MLLLSFINFFSLIMHCLSVESEQQDDEVQLRRYRREPAIWGEPAPDYSGAILDGNIRLLHALLFIDSKIEKHYSFNITVIRSEVSKLIKDANNYFYQINVRIIVIDILLTHRNDLSLYSFEDFRSKRLSTLPEHDFAALISYRYAGGLAFVGGMCTIKAVLLCGFYPHNPAAMGGIFFHEVAHLIGVPHRNKSQSLNVPNCYCNNINRKSESSGCLKIPGYDHDCTLQQMANLLGKNRCLKKLERFSLFTAPIYEDSLPICGNGIIEKNETCDCGPENFCYNINCNKTFCVHLIRPWQLYIIAAAIIVLLCLPFFLYANICRRKHYSIHKIISNLPIKKWIFAEDKWNQTSNYRKSMERIGNNIAQSRLNHKYKINSSHIILLEKTDKDKLVRRPTITRPTAPPPSPPIITKSLTSFSISKKKLTTSATMPPLRIEVPQPPVLQDFAHSSDLQSNHYETPITSKRISKINDGYDYSIDYESISNKFDDFDSDESYEEMQIENKNRKSTDYTPVIPREQRNAKDIGTKGYDSPIQENESFTSNKSFDQNSSNDTRSTDLSERDENELNVKNIIKKFNQRNWLV